MLAKRSPKGGNPLNRLDTAVFVDGVINYKIGYCDCGKPILASSEDIEDLAETFSWAGEKRKHTPISVKLAKWILSKHVDK